MQSPSGEVTDNLIKQCLMTAKELQEKLSHYYELDLSNCLMTNEDWIQELANALANPTEYLKGFEKEYEEYLEMINA